MHWGVSTDKVVSGVLSGTLSQGKVRLERWGLTSFTPCDLRWLLKTVCSLFLQLSNEDNDSYPFLEWDFEIYKWKYYLYSRGSQTRKINDFHKCNIFLSCIIPVWNVMSSSWHSHTEDGCERQVLIIILYIYIYTDPLYSRPVCVIVSIYLYVCVCITDTQNTTWCEREPFPSHVRGADCLCSSLR